MCLNIQITYIEIQSWRDIDESLEANFKLVLNMNKLSRSDIFLFPTI